MVKRVGVKRKRSPRKAPIQAEPAPAITVEELIRLAIGDMPPDDDMLFWSTPGPLPSEERAAEKGTP